MKPQEFIDQIAKAAQAVAKQSGVPASLSIAQAALESGWGESGLAKTGNNLFGIKADSLWRGQTLTLNTKEFIKGQWVVVPALWRKYLLKLVAFVGAELVGFMGTPVESHATVAWFR